MDNSENSAIADKPKSLTLPSGADTSALIGLLALLESAEHPATATTLDEATAKTIELLESKTLETTIARTLELQLHQALSRALSQL